MNLLAHTLVARTCGLGSAPDVLGAVLPDLVGRYGDLSDLTCAFGS